MGRLTRHGQTLQDFRRGYIVAGMDFEGPIRFQSKAGTIG